MKNVFVIPLLAFGLVAGIQTMGAQSAKSNDTVTTISQEKYIEVVIEKLPQAVIDTVVKDYKKATINKATAKEDNSVFKLQLTKENGETVELYCDAKGNWITKK